MTEQEQEQVTKGLAGGVVVAHRLASFCLSGLPIGDGSGLADTPVGSVEPLQDRSQLGTNGQGLPLRRR